MPHSLFPTFVGFPPWVPPLLEVVPLLAFCVGILAQTYLASLPRNIFRLKPFVVKHGPTSFPAINVNAFGNLHDSGCPQKVWKLKQGIHHQLLFSNLKKYISYQSCPS
jgi:hypothetical protein